MLAGWAVKEKDGNPNNLLTFRFGLAVWEASKCHVRVGMPVYCSSLDKKKPEQVFNLKTLCMVREIVFFSALTVYFAEINKPNKNWESTD